MTIPALSTPLAPMPRAITDPRSARTDATATRPSPTAAPIADTRATERASDRASTSAVQAPPGTDPALWSILTGEERQFFARAVTSGPLTYSKVMFGRPTAPAAPAIRGGRLDVRA
ncbi:MAG: hypothetical protein K2X99_07690 [Gemmatimonadaceae bacterium]|nr:hypothetical protein [Gemmatimonadaceae bacterium]